MDTTPLSTVDDGENGAEEDDECIGNGLLCFECYMEGKGFDV